MASESLAEAQSEVEQDRAAHPFTWISYPMGARVDLDDRIALEHLAGVNGPADA